MRVILVTLPGNKEEHFQVAGRAIPFAAGKGQQHFEIDINLVGIRNRSKGGCGENISGFVVGGSCYKVIRMYIRGCIARRHIRGCVVNGCD